MNSSAPRSPPLWVPYLLAFVAALLGTVLLLAFFLWNAHRQVDHAVEVAMQNMTATSEANFDASLRRIENNLEHIAAELPDGALDQKNIARFAQQTISDLNYRTHRFPEANSFRIFDAQGDSLYNSGPAVPRYSVADRAYFQCAQANPAPQLCISEAIVGKATKVPVVVIAKTLTGADDRFSGIVLGSLEMSYFTKFLSTLDLGTNGAIALRRTEDGALVARWPDAPGALNVPYKPEHPLWPWLKSGKREGALKITAQTDGVERLYVFRRLQRYPFMIVAGRATQDYLAEWRQTALISIGFSSAILLALAFFLRRQWLARTEEIRYNRELAVARDAAEAASRAKSTFLANMSHELRTPMNGIMGMIDLVMRRVTDPGQLDQLSKAKVAAQHLLHVINDILDLSKIEAERLTLEQVTFRLGEVLENLMSLIGQKALDKKLQLCVDLTPEVARLSLIGDPLRLGQILLNLTGNAIKFTAQGSITLRARLVEENASEVVLHFEVQDTGIGIATEDQKRLFTAFEQADGSMTRKYGGTGLGLAISKRLVKMMGGEVGVDSTVGQGSTFWFTVRLGKAADAVLPAPTFPDISAEERLRSRFAGTRILLAEDEPINREVSRSLLEDVGLRVDTAEDGIIAVAMAHRTPYALILMDMQMPHMNGVDATRAIRALPGYAETPILAMTANAFDEDRKVCLDAGMDDHIGKPVDPDRLFETLLKWLSN